MTDPMTSYEQAESEAVERQDEARREQHWREAEQAVAHYITRFRSFWDGRAESDIVLNLITFQLDERYTSDEPDAFIIRAFLADYGTPALLRVIATAMENSK